MIAMAWLYLFIASLCEIGWTICVKLVDIKKIGAIPWLHFFKDTNTNFLVLLPLLGYIVLGALNIVFFYLASKQIPISTAMAVWLGTALIGVKLVDVFVFKQGYTFSQIFFFALILVGLIGLKSSDAK